MNSHLISNARFLGLTRVFPPNRLTIASVVFAGLTRVHQIHADTDHATADVCSSRPHPAPRSVDGADWRDADR